MKFYMTIMKIITEVQIELSNFHQIPIRCNKTSNLPVKRARCIRTRLHISFSKYCEKFLMYNIIFQRKNSLLFIITEKYNSRENLL